MSSITSECLFGADAKKRAAATAWGEQLLERLLGGNERDLKRVASAVGTAIAKTAAGAAGQFEPTPPWMRALLSGQQPAQCGPFGPLSKAARAEVGEQTAGRFTSEGAHDDKPTARRALPVKAHRDLSQAHEVHAYREEHAGHLEGAQAHRNAALAHRHAADMASRRDPDHALESYRAREATRFTNEASNRSDARERWHNPVALPAYTQKAAASGDGFSAPAGPQPVRQQRFQEPLANPYAFWTSGSVSGAPREAGDDNDPTQPARQPRVQEPASMMELLFGPAAERGAAMDWPANPDPRGAWMESQPTLQELHSQRGGGIYPVNGKAAGSLTALAEARLAGSVYAPLAKSLDLAHALTVAGKLPEGTYRAILRLRDFKVRASKSTYRSIQADDDYRSTVRAIQAAAIEPAHRETLLASIA